MTLLHERFVHDAVGLDRGDGCLRSNSGLRSHPDTVDVPAPTSGHGDQHEGEVPPCNRRDPLVAFGRHPRSPLECSPGIR